MFGIFGMIFKWIGGSFIGRIVGSLFGSGGKARKAVAGNKMTTLFIIAAIAGGGYSWWTITSLQDDVAECRQTVEKKKQKIHKLRGEKLRAEDKIREQNEAFDEFKETKASLERRIDDVREKNDRLETEYSRRISEIYNETIPDSSCEGSVDYLIEKATELDWTNEEDNK